MDFLTDLTLPPVVQGHSLLCTKGCGVPGRAKFTPVSFLFPAPRRAVSVLCYVVESAQDTHRQRGTNGDSYLFFLCFPLSRTPPPLLGPLFALP